MITMKAAKTSYTVSIPPTPPGMDIPLAIANLVGPYGDVYVMAASMSVATPRDLCGLRALVEHAALVADSVHFDCPNDEQLHRYLDRMGFYDGLPANVAMSRQRPSLRGNRLSTKLIELRRIDSADAVEELANCVWHVAVAQFARGRVATACATAIASATENVLDHAKSPIGGFVAARRYDQSGIELAVVDLGLGIPATLRQKPKYADLSDLDAVQQALRDGVTCTDEIGRGAGLSELIKAVRVAGTSTLVIQSSTAHVSANAGHTAVQLMTQAKPMPGTWISLRLKP